MAVTQREMLLVVILAWRSVTKRGFADCVQEVIATAME